MPILTHNSSRKNSNLTSVVSLMIWHSGLLQSRTRDLESQLIKLPLLSTSSCRESSVTDSILWYPMAGQTDASLKTSSLRLWLLYSAVVSVQRWSSLSKCKYSFNWYVVRKSFTSHVEKFNTMNLGMTSIKTATSQPKTSIEFSATSHSTLGHWILTRLSKRPSLHWQNTAKTSVILWSKQIHH